MATALSYIPQNCPLTILYGDTLNMGITIAADISGRVYSSGLTDGKGNTLFEMDVTVVETSTGKIKVTIFEADWIVIKPILISNPDISWYFTQIISDTYTTLLQGKVSVRYK